jgi:predicted kinase
MPSGHRSGAGRTRDESKLLARKLALSLAQAHLEAGYDVIVPQYLGRSEFILALGDAAHHAAAEFVEVLVQDTEAAIILRLRGRRNEFADQDCRLPQADLDGAAVPSVIAEACEQLRNIRAERVRTQVVMVTDGIESGYLALRRAGGDSDP